MAAHDPDAEVVGKYMMAFVEASGEVSSVFQQRTQEIFEKHLGELEADGWYENRDVVAAFDELLGTVGPKTMESGGVASAEALPFSDDLSLEEAFQRLNEEHTSEKVFRASDMDAPCGEFTFELDGNRSARLGITEGYMLTEPFAKGTFTGVIDRWGPADTVIGFEETAPRDNERAAWNVMW